MRVPQDALVLCAKFGGHAHLPYILSLLHYNFLTQVALATKLGTQYKGVLGDTHTKFGRPDYLTSGLRTLSFPVFKLCPICPKFNTRVQGAGTNTPTNAYTYAHLYK